MSKPIKNGLSIALVLGGIVIGLVLAAGLGISNPAGAGIPVPLPADEPGQALASGGSNDVQG